MQKAAAAWGGGEFTVFEDGFASSHDVDDFASGLFSVEWGVAGEAVEGIFVQGVALVFDEEDVCVETWQEGAFVRPEAIDFGGGFGQETSDLWPGDARHGGCERQKGFEARESARGVLGIMAFLGARVGAVICDEA